MHLDLFVDFSTIWNVFLTSLLFLAFVINLINCVSLALLYIFMFVSCGFDFISLVPAMCWLERASPR